jgi:hypothetical protein
MDVYELCMLMHSHMLGAPYGSLTLECIRAVHANAQSYAKHAIGTLRLEPVNTQQEVK